MKPFFTWDTLKVRCRPAGGIRSSLLWRIKECYSRRWTGWCSQRCCSEWNWWYTTRLEDWFWDRWFLRMMGLQNTPWIVQILKDADSRLDPIILELKVAVQTTFQRSTFWISHASGSSSRNCSSEVLIASILAVEGQSLFVLCPSDELEWYHK